MRTDDQKKLLNKGFTLYRKSYDSSNSTHVVQMKRSEQKGWIVINSFEDFAELNKFVEAQLRYELTILI